MPSVDIYASYCLGNSCMPLIRYLHDSLFPTATALQNAEFYA